MITDERLIQEAKRTLSRLRGNPPTTIFDADVQAAIRYLVSQDALAPETAKWLICQVFGYNSQAHYFSREDEMHVENAVHAAFNLPPAASPAWMVKGAKVLHVGHNQHGSVFIIGGTNGSYVALHGPIADLDERGDARERDTDVTPTYVVWMRVTSDKLFPFDGMILPHSFRGLLKLAVEQRAAEMPTKST